MVKLRSVEFVGHAGSLSNSDHCHPTHPISILQEYRNVRKLYVSLGAYLHTNITLLTFLYLKKNSGNHWKNMEFLIFKVLVNKHLRGVGKSQCYHFWYSQYCNELMIFWTFRWAIELLLTPSASWDIFICLSLICGFPEGIARTHELQNRFSTNDNFD